MNEPTRIESVTVLIDDTNRLAIQDEKRQQLIAELQPIAAKIDGYRHYAETLHVVTAEHAAVAAAVREGITKSSTDAEALIRQFDEHVVERIFRSHRAWTSLIAVFTTPLNDAAKRIKQKCIAWQQAEEEKAAKEQARLQAEADERARKDRERLEKQAEKLKTPELKQERMEQAAQIVAPIVRVAAPAAAVKSQSRWKVKSVDKATFLTAAAQDKNLHGYVDVLTTNLERAKAANASIEIAGVVFHKIVV